MEHFKTHELFPGVDRFWPNCSLSLWMTTKWKQDVLHQKVMAFSTEG